MSSVSHKLGLNSSVQSYGIDQLLLISDSTPRGLKAAYRIYDLAMEMGLKTGSSTLLVNRVKEPSLPQLCVELAEQLKVERVNYVPEDEMVSECDISGQALIDVTEATSEAYRAVRALVGRWLDKGVGVGSLNR